MPIELAYLEDNGVLLSGFGILTAYDIKEVNNTLYETPQKIQKITYQLCDFTRVTQVEISSEEIGAIAEQDAKAGEINPNMFIAVVGEEDLVFGLSRMWETLADTIPFEKHVFRQMEDAQKWIAEKRQFLIPDQ